MGLFLFRFWPVLLPIIAFLMWMILVRSKAKKAGAPLPRFRDGPWFSAVMASFAIGFMLFLVLGLSHDEQRGAYSPPRVENGKMIPGRVEAP